jgi:hypothetical protein
LTVLWASGPPSILLCFTTSRLPRGISLVDADDDATLTGGRLVSRAVVERDLGCTANAEEEVWLFFVSSGGGFVRVVCGRDVGWDRVEDTDLALISRYFLVVGESGPTKLNGRN